LVELLVVILVMAILAAIATMVFLNQREKSYVSQVHSALKGAAVAAEDFAVASGGSYQGLHGDTGPLLSQHGFAKPSWATILTVRATTTGFCVRIRHSRLRAGTPWRTAIYESSAGRPSQTNNCP
jgi:Tfp pilus assembly protein PilE